MIPKIIHYCWLSNDFVPESLQKYMKSWKEKLPDYDFMLWNFERFDKSSSLWVSQAFDNKKYAFAADYIRLFAVYNYGGIYLDMDIEVLKSFDDLLDSQIMIGYERDDKPWIEAGCFGAEKGNPFIKDCLSYYKNREFIKADGAFDMLPLPQIMSRFMEFHINIRPYCWTYFTNKSYETGVVYYNTEGYSIHHFAGSWVDEFSKKINLIKNRIYSKVDNKIIRKMLLSFAVALARFNHYGISQTVKYYFVDRIKKCQM